MNKYVHQNPYLWGSFEAEVENVRRFMKERILWMDNRLNYPFVPSTVSITHIDFFQPYQVYTLQGKACGNELRGLPRGVYIVRQGEAARKVTVE